MALRWKSGHDKSHSAAILREARQTVVERHPQLSSRVQFKKRESHQHSLQNNDRRQVAVEEIIHGRYADAREEIRALVASTKRSYCCMRGQLPNKYLNNSIPFGLPGSDRNSIPHIQHSIAAPQNALLPSPMNREIPATTLHRYAAPQKRRFCFGKEDVPNKRQRITSTLQSIALQPAAGLSANRPSQRISFHIDAQSRAHIYSISPDWVLKNSRSKLCVRMPVSAEHVEDIARSLFRIDIRDHGSWRSIGPNTKIVKSFRLYNAYPEEDGVIKTFGKSFGERIMKSTQERTKRSSKNLLRMEIYPEGRLAAHVLVDI